MRRFRRLHLVLSWLLVLGLVPGPWSQPERWRPLVDWAASTARAQDDDEAPRPQPIRAASRPQLPTVSLWLILHQGFAAKLHRVFTAKVHQPFTATVHRALMGAAV